MGVMQLNGLINAPINVMPDPREGGDTQGN